MGDSPQPKKAALTCEVPDLELPPVRRADSRGLPSEAHARRVEYGGLNLFDEEAFTPGKPTLELGGEHEPASTNLAPGLELDFDARGGLELQEDELANDALERPSEARARTSKDAQREAEPHPISAEEIRLFANYGDAPTSAYLAPAYVYRVLRRKRELRRALDRLQGERTRAKSERERAERTNADEAAVQRAGEHALVLRSELCSRALDAYDRARFAQGVRLTCTVAAIVIFLLLLKFGL